MNENNGEEILRRIIRSKINHVSDVKYDRLDMSGYNNSWHYNMEIISRFRNYMHPIADSDLREFPFLTVRFWKGSGEIIRVNENTIEVVNHVGGETTEDIIFRLITAQNSCVLEDLVLKANNWRLDGVR
jgi:hypothetical protein